MCEETGHYYSTVQSNVDDPSDQIYSKVDSNNNEIATKDKSIPSQVPEPHSPVEQLYAQVEKKMSTPQPEESSTLMDQLYAQVEKTKDSETKSPRLDDHSSSIDQLYAQVNKKKTNTYTPQLEEPSSSIDQLYAQVDKTKKKNKLESTTQLEEPSSSIEWLQISECDRGVATEGTSDMEVETSRGNTFILRDNEAYVTRK